MWISGLMAVFLMQSPVLENAPDGVVGQKIKEGADELEQDSAVQSAPSFEGDQDLRDVKTLDVVPLAPPPRKKYRWLECIPNMSPCERPVMARWTLLGSSLVMGGAAYGFIFGLGDRLGGQDPGPMIAGAAAVGAAGAILGSLAGIWRGDRPNSPDRIARAALELGTSLNGGAALDERAPFGLELRFGPTLRFPKKLGRLRLEGSIGGDFSRGKQSDPRPQFSTELNAQEGTFPIVSARQELRFDLAFDLAVAMPEARESLRIGSWELRYKPSVHYRRETLSLSNQPREYERVMLLPLTVGLRYHLSVRQRFTFYVGPRFDFLGYGATDISARTTVLTPPVYGEAWFDLDLPFSRRLRQDGLSRRLEVNGQVNLGYVHSRFDGNGFNIGAVVGFLGYAQGAFSLRVRKRGSKIAYQGTVGMNFGSSFTPFMRLGIVLPDIKVKK